MRSNILCNQASMCCFERRGFTHLALLLVLNPFEFREGSISPVPRFSTTDWGNGHRLPSHIFDGMNRRHLVSLTAATEVQKSWPRSLVAKGISGSAHRSWITATSRCTFNNRAPQDPFTIVSLLLKHLYDLLSKRNGQFCIASFLSNWQRRAPHHH